MVIYLTIFDIGSTVGYSTMNTVDMIPSCSTGLTFWVIYTLGRANLCSDVPKVKNFICSPPPWSFDLVHKVSKMNKKLKINACLGSNMATYLFTTMVFLIKLQLKTFGAKKLLIKSC